MKKNTKKFNIVWKKWYLNRNKQNENKNKIDLSNELSWWV